LRVTDALEIHTKGRIRMASSSKKKTTMKKLNRENAVRERQLRKRAKKNARKQATADAPGGPGETRTGDDSVTEARHVPDNPPGVDSRLIVQRADVQRAH
jgi:hypothetical protein